MEDMCGKASRQKQAGQRLSGQSWTFARRAGRALPDSGGNHIDHVADYPAQSLPIPLHSSDFYVDGERYRDVFWL